MTAPRPPRKAPKPIKYYWVDATLTSVPGYEILNYGTLQTETRGLCAKSGWPDGYLQLPNGPWRFPDYVETPRLLIDRKLGRPMRDLENRDGFWIVSEPLKAVIEAIDPTACDFRCCDVVLASGEPGPARWFCTITRAFVGAVDIEKSEDLRAYWKPDGKLSLGINVGSTKLALRPEIIGVPHLFVIAEMASDKYCSQAFKDACKAAKLTGISFSQMT